MNKFIITAGLVADPELHYSQSGKAVARIRVAVKRGYKNSSGEYESDFFNLSCFEKKAEFAAEYLRKGSKALFTCTIKNSNYEDKETKKIVYKDEIYIEEIEFLSSKKKDGEVSKENLSDIGEVIDEETFPF